MNMQENPTLTNSVAPSRRGLSPLLFGALLACGGNQLPAKPPPGTTTTAGPAPKLSLHDAGFNAPESVLYDAKTDVYLVSNINGSPGAVDDNGYISRVAPDGSKVEAKWIEAGKNGVKLDAPKGTAIVDRMLYVADITRLRTFDADSGKPRGDIALPGCTFANDVTAGPDGRVYVSDSGIEFDEKGNPVPTKSDAVYVVDKGHAKTLAKGEDLGHPNGLVWSGAKLWVVTFGTGEIYSLDESGKKADAHKLPKGMLDGIVALADGSFLVSSWEGTAVYRGKPGGDWSLLLGDLRAPADIGYDSKRNRILVPLSMDNAVEATPAPLRVAARL